MDGGTRDMRQRSTRIASILLALALVVVGGSWGSSVDAAAFPNDPDYIRQWGLRRIGVPAAWKTTKGKGAVVAVIDTGVNYRHPDLKANVMKLQRDVINDDGDALDLSGHGTSVAGVIAATTNNKQGVAGVAPASKILAVRAFSLEAGGFRGTDVAEAIMWAADNGADVINLSLGGPVLATEGGIGTALGPEDFTSIAYATAQGALVVAAAGNGGSDRVGDPHCETPAIVPLTLCVGATDSLDRMASFSNYGGRLDIVAPGQGIYTTGSRGITIGYGSSDGTSLAAPMVAGVAALLMSMGADNVTAGLILRSSAKDLGLPGYDLTYGWGRLDAKAAVEMCKQIC